MDRFIYSKEQLEEILNILNTFQFTGFESANKMSRIYQILNTPFTEKSAVIKQSPQEDNQIS